MSKPNVARLILVVTLIACTIFAVTFINASIYHVPEEEVAVSLPTPVSTSTPGAPKRLIIPRLNVDAVVQDVGVGKSGNMAVPLRYEDVGWYRYGPLPGEVGSAVIDGHVDNGFGLSAVFKDLHTLAPGDDILVETASGEQVHFVVEQVVDYRVADVPLDLLFNRADTPRLNLITCAGAWVAEEKQYDSRTVVYAVAR